MSSGKRHVLDGVPKVAFAPIHDGKFEFTPFPSCLKSVCGFLGYRFAYHYLLGASGAAFRLVWNETRWDGGNVDIAFMSERPFEPMFRAFEAAGLDFTVLVNNQKTWGSHPNFAEARASHLENLIGRDLETFRDTIVASIDRGVPLIALGVVGPPEASIITGYDDGGDTLIGWSMFQEHLDPTHDLEIGSEDELNPPAEIEKSGYFRQTDWYRRTHAVFAPGRFREIDRPEILRRSLESIPRIVGGGRSYEYLTGTAAYDAYIEHLCCDEEFPPHDAVLLAERKMVHYDAMTMIAERGKGAQFVRDAADVFACARKELSTAADLFQTAGDEMAAWWKIVGPIWDDEDAQVCMMADDEKRRAFVPHVEKSRDCDAEAGRIIANSISNLSS